MTSVDTRYLQYERLTRAEEWAAAYRQRGLTRAVEHAGKVIMWTGGPVAALHMPAYLGQPVYEWLRQLMMPGPILAQLVRGLADRYTFLAQPNITPRVDTTAELAAAGAVLCIASTPLLLPITTVREPQSAWWVHPPEAGRDLPLLSAVVCAARVTARARWAAR